jgi:hypothetical protein
MPSDESRALVQAESGSLSAVAGARPVVPASGDLLSLDGELGLPRVTGLLEVVGILFELPN